MTTGIGAAWAHGGAPPWMEQPPWFDECDAADRADDLAAALLAEWRGDPAAQLAERFGPLAEVTAERGRLPRPPALAELAATRRRTPVDYAGRRAVLEAALQPTEDHPTALDYGRRAA